MPEDLKAAATFAGSLAEDHPDLFGYPWPNMGTRELEVRVTGSSGEALAREWIAGNAKRTQPKPPPLDLPRPQVPVKFVTVDRSVRRLTEIQHGVLPTTDLPDGDAIWMIGPDPKRNAMVITIDHMSDRLLRALASRYGTSAIAIRVEPNPRFRNLRTSQQHDARFDFLAESGCSGRTRLAFRDGSGKLIGCLHLPKGRCDSSAIGPGASGRHGPVRPSSAS